MTGTLTILAWVPCANGTRVATCYHTPRCAPLKPGQRPGEGPFGQWAQLPPGRVDPSQLECTACGELYHKQCMHCHRPGVPYEYNGQVFDGLTAYKGEQLCPACRDAIMAVEGVNILVADDRPGHEPYVVNTVRDRDVAHIFVPPELRGVDGRDLYRRRRAAR